MRGGGEGGGERGGGNPSTPSQVLKRLRTFAENLFSTNTLSVVTLYNLY